MRGWILRSKVNVGVNCHAKRQTQGQCSAWLWQHRVYPCLGYGTLTHDTLSSAWPLLSCWALTHNPLTRHLICHSKISFYGRLNGQIFALSCGFHLLLGSNHIRSRSPVHSNSRAFSHGWIKFIWLFLTLKTILSWLTSLSFSRPCSLVLELPTAYMHYIVLFYCDFLNREITSTIAYQITLHAPYSHGITFWFQFFFVLYLCCFYRTKICNLQNK